MAGSKGRSGGLRAGAGRKANTARVIRLRGGQKASVVRPVEQVASVEQPAGLSEQVAATWVELAPHAVKAGTLVPSTAVAFRRLCQSVVQHAKMQAQIEADGFTYLKVMIDGAGAEHNEIKAHPLISRAHALDNAIRAWFKDFGINPFGKPLAEAAPKVEDPFAQFEQVG